MFEILLLSRILNKKNLECWLVDVQFKNDLGHHFRQSVVCLIKSRIDVLGKITSFIK